MKVAVLALALASCAPLNARPTVLRFTPEAYNRVAFLAAGLHREMKLCLYGTTAGDTATVTHVGIAYIHYASDVRIRADVCPAYALAAWHNHPPLRVLLPVGCDPANVSGVFCNPVYAAVHPEPTALCALSGQDRRTARDADVPFQVVSVTPYVACWWTREQAATDTVPLYAIEGQRTW